MAMQQSTAVRNAGLDAKVTAIGASPILRIYDLTAGAPANCAAAITGTLLAEMTLPATWMGAAAAGVISKSGTWQDLAANNTGTADFYRIWDSAGTTCHIQGTVTASGGGGDMIVSNTSFASGQTVTVSTYTVTDNNA